MTAPVLPCLKLSFPATQEFWKVPVLLADEHLMVLDKPAGLATSPDLRDPAQPSLMGLLHQAIRDRKPWAQERQLGYVANVILLDADTSGILLLARTKAVGIGLVDQFGAAQPLLTCQALVQGVPQADQFTVDTRLAPHPTLPGVLRVDPHHGRKTVTHFELEERFQDNALLRCQPIGSQPHSVRAQLRSRQIPLVGDTLYGGQPLRLSQIKPGYRFKRGLPERPLIDRAALHVSDLRFTHPVTGAELHIESPLPRDIEAGLKYLRRFAPPRPVDSTPPVTASGEPEAD